MKRIITVTASDDSTAASTRYIMKSMEQIIESVDGEAYMGEIISAAQDAGYTMDVSDLMNIDVYATEAHNSIWLPTIYVRTFSFKNKLTFNVKCKFPELSEDESYHIQHWIQEWAKVADFVHALTRFQLDLRPFM